MAPDLVADTVLDAIRSGRFWILTHPELGSAILGRAQNMVAGTNPGLDPGPT